MLKSLITALVLLTASLSASSSTAAIHGISASPPPPPPTPLPTINCGALVVDAGCSASPRAGAIQDGNYINVDLLTVSQPGSGEGIAQTGQTYTPHELPDDSGATTNPSQNLAGKTYPIGIPASAILVGSISGNTLTVTSVFYGSVVLSASYNITLDERHGPVLQGTHITGTSSGCSGTYVACYTVDKSQTLNPSYLYAYNLKSPDQAPSDPATNGACVGGYSKQTNVLNSWMQLSCSGAADAVDLEGYDFSAGNLCQDSHAICVDGKSTKLIFGSLASLKVGASKGTMDQGLNQSAYNLCQFTGGTGGVSSTTLTITALTGGSNNCGTAGSAYFSNGSYVTGSGISTAPEIVIPNPGWQLITVASLPQTITLSTAQTISNGTLLTTNNAGTNSTGVAIMVQFTAGTYTDTWVNDYFDNCAYPDAYCPVGFSSYITPATVSGPGVVPDNQVNMGARRWFGSIWANSNRTGSSNITYSVILGTDGREYNRAHTTCGAGVVMRVLRNTCDVYDWHYDVASVGVYSPYGAHGELDLLGSQACAAGPAGTGGGPCLEVYFYKVDYSTLLVDGKSMNNQNGIVIQATTHSVSNPQVIDGIAPGALYALGCVDAAVFQVGGYPVPANPLGAPNNYPTVITAFNGTTLGSSTALTLSGAVNPSIPEGTVVTFRFYLGYPGHDQIGRAGCAGNAGTATLVPWGSANGSFLQVDNFEAIGNVFAVNQGAIYGETSVCPYPQTNTFSTYAQAVFCWATEGSSGPAYSHDFVVNATVQGNHIDSTGAFGFFGEATYSIPAVNTTASSTDLVTTTKGLAPGYFLVDSLDGASTTGASGPVTCTQVGGCFQGNQAPPYIVSSNGLYNGTGVCPSGLTGTCYDFTLSYAAATTVTNGQFWEHNANPDYGSVGAGTANVNMVAYGGKSTPYCTTPYHINPGIHQGCGGEIP